MAAKKVIPFPDKKDILDFISKNPGKISKREIARAFHIRGDNRIKLKKLLREMSEEGKLEKGHKKQVFVGGELPPVSVVEITGIDKHGDLKAKPTNWKDEDGGDKNPPPILISAYDKRATLGIGERALVRLTRDRDFKDIAYVGKIIRKLEMSVTLVMGSFKKHDDNIAIVHPTDKKSRDEYVVPKADWNGAKDGELVLIETKVKSRSSRGSGRGRGPKPAVVKDCLGTLEDPRSISMIAVHTHGILTEFSDEALAEAEKSEKPVLGSREDLRHIPLITVDPADARDHDDAIWAEKDTDPKNPEGWHIIVAIADVAHYVTPDSALEKDAWKRGNSTYFPDRVVPMLPERLSNGLCSLKEGEDRYTMAVHIWFDHRGKKLRHKFVRGLMRSAAALSYPEFQNAFEGDVSERAAPLLDEVIKPLFGAFDCLGKGRAFRAPLELEMPERKIIIGDDGHVASIETRISLPAHKLVEEFMIQANVAAAEELEKKQTTCMYRIHEPPSEDKLMAFREFLDSLGYKFAKGQVAQAKLFNNILATVEDSPHQDVVNTLTLRTQSQAIYSSQNKGHFGLSLSRYGHFTSPIRRYADLMVHRALVKALKLGKDGLSAADEENFEATAEHISTTERVSMLAERESNDRYVAAFMGDHVGDEFAGKISGVNRAGLFIRIDKNGGEGFIPISSLGGDYFIHDRDLHLLEGEYTGIIYQLGDAVNVKLVEASRLTGGLRFELIDPELARKGSTRKKSGKGRNARNSGKKYYKRSGRGRR